MAINRISIIAISIWLYPAVIFAGHLYPEKHYQDKWCAEQAGQLEYVLPDNARVDCLTSTHAVEVDFAPKFAEGIGQALYYAEITKKAPGVLLIMENPKKDKVFLDRLNAVAKTRGITVWTISP